MTTNISPAQSSGADSCPAPESGPVGKPSDTNQLVTDIRMAVDAIPSHQTASVDQLDKNAAFRALFVSLGAA